MQLLYNSLNIFVFQLKKDIKCGQIFENSDKVFIVLHETTVVVVYINTMKTTFDLNFEFYQSLAHGYTQT